MDWTRLLTMFDRHPTPASQFVVVSTVLILFLGIVFVMVHFGWPALIVLGTIVAVWVVTFYIYCVYLIITGQD